jgi:carboxylesterase
MTADAVQPAHKPPVLLLHGLTGAPGDMQVITKHLRRIGYHVETPMLPGHGLDEKGLLKTGWKDWLADSERALLHVTANGEKAFVGGLSMGAVLSLALAAKHSDRVKGVVCYAPTLRYDGWIVPRGTWFVPYGAYIPIVNRYRFKERPPYGIKDERLRAKMEEMLFSGAIADAGLPFMPGKSLAQNLSLIRYVKRLLPNITAPMLIVHSTEDDITHIRNAEDLAAKVNGPVRKLYLTDSYHLVTVDRERAKVAKATEAFFEELIAGVEMTTDPSPPAGEGGAHAKRGRVRGRAAALKAPGQKPLIRRLRRRLLPQGEKG